MTARHISVIISTRNRPRDVERCLVSLSRVMYARWDITLIDQSDDKRTHDAVEKLTDILPPLMYRHSSEKGLSRARNEGMNVSQGDIFAFLDDDCTVEPTWLEDVAGLFDRYPHAAIAFGAVEASAHDQQTTFISAYTPRKERVLRGQWSSFRVTGMGASMYLRRAIAQRVGSFDVCLGAGSSLFKSTEETDYAYRTLALGKEIVETPMVQVHHYGARDFQSGAFAQLIRDHAYASGALDMKVLRCRGAAGLILLVVHSCAYLMKVDVRNLVLGRRPNRLAWIVMYVRGLGAGRRLGVDRQRCLFVDTLEG